MRRAKSTWLFVLAFIAVAFVAITFFLIGKFSSIETYLSPRTSVGFYDSFSCRGPILAEGIFPPSDIIPILPPQNEHPYIKPSYACRHFAFDFCEATKTMPSYLKCDVLVFDHHAINTFFYKDPETGKDYLCFVEPQNITNYFCKPLEDADSYLNDEWMRKSLCQEFYNFSEGDCKLRWWEAPRCDDIDLSHLGTSCVPSQPTQLCLSSGDSLRVISCECTGFIVKRCTWQSNFVKSADAHTSAS